MSIGKTKDLEMLEHKLVSNSLTCKDLKSAFQNHSDIQFPPVQSAYSLEGIAVFYCMGMIDTQQLNTYIRNVLNHIRDYPAETNTEGLPPLLQSTSVNDMIDKLFSGNVIFFHHGHDVFYALDISKIPQRNPEESNTDVAIKGPKDAFTESLYTNTSLIRKRLKTSYLFSETFTIGSVTHSKISLLYLENKVNKKLIIEAKKRLANIQTESILSGGQLEQWLSDKTLSLFPLFDYSTRPDFAIESMLRGRFVIILDGSPLVLIGPSNLLLLIKSAEDTHFPYHYVIFQRILRIIGMVIAIFLPGFYVAIASINLSQLPFSLLATIVMSRQGIPFPLLIEALLILGLFEILREAGVRMPTVLGHTVSIVGGLIIGDAAIRAGLASPILIVIISLSAVSTYTLVNQSLTGTVSILRIYVILCSSFLGVFGFFVSMLSILIYLCNLQSFQLSYLEPLTSLTFRDYLTALLQNPFKTKDFSSHLLKKKEKEN
ncbi:spore germination protein [Bacillus pumilus]|uniref:Spore germination protein n=1 Tax=Bacillus pumilus TaxID=1408 RepID=A0A2A5IVH5_BACPU|nr:spore germination protein [Bacillus pumilus]PCK21338.1 spore germination protein [Bacillus pumilus]